MNITIITEVLPWPLSSGGAQGQFNIIDQLRKHHHFTLIFIENRVNKISSMKELQEKWPDVNIICYPLWRQLLNPRFFKDKVERAFKLTFTPDNPRFKVERILKPYGLVFSKDFTGFVNDIIRKENTDLIEVNFFTCLEAVNYLPANIRKVFVHHELRYVRNERMTKPFELTPEETELKAKVKEQEIDNLGKYDSIITLTEQDKRFLLEEGIETPVYVSPFAVQTTSCPFQEWNGKLSYVGGYNHIPNQEGIDWYVTDILPLLGDRAPLLDIVGKDWPKNYQTPHIQLKGFVHDLATAIHGSIMIVPLLTGSGMRMKIVEAMAMSMPIITTSVGVEGIPLVNGESCIIADSPKDFARAIEHLASHPDLCRKLGIAANRIFQESYSPAFLAKVRENIYQQLVDSK